MRVCEQGYCTLLQHTLYYNILSVIERMALVFGSSPEVHLKIMLLMVCIIPMNRSFNNLVLLSCIDLVWLMTAAVIVSIKRWVSLLPENENSKTLFQTT
jgi:hypothetical protein